MKKIKSISLQSLGVFIAFLWIIFSVSLIVSDKSFTRDHHSTEQIVAEEDTQTEGHSDVYFIAASFSFSRENSFFLNLNYFSQFKMLVGNNHLNYLYRHCSRTISIREILI